MKIKIIRIIALLILISFFGCENPFSPKADYSQNNGIGMISDLSTPDGIFQNMQYAYNFKDTTIYGGILDPNFIFTFHDYEEQFDVSWGRTEEMKVTYGLFDNTERLDLIWNNIILSTQDSLNANIVRGFNLTITFNPNDILRVDGRVNLSLSKNKDGKWQIVKWLDESNFYNKYFLLYDFFVIKELSINYRAKFSFFLH